MKDNLGSDYLLFAHVDTDRVRFSKGLELGIEFKNQIDAWNRMSFKFRGRLSDTKYAHKDLKPFVYSVRSLITEEP
jgi:hypothetical protein